MIFPPFQYPQCALNGRTLAVQGINAEIGHGGAETPGTIVGVSAAGIDAAVADGVIRVCQLVDAARPSASDVLASIRVGDRLA